LSFSPNISHLKALIISLKHQEVFLLITPNREACHLSLNTTVQTSFCLVNKAGLITADIHHTLSVMKRNYQGSNLLNKKQIR